MKFTITREHLQEGLVAVAASVPAKTTLPVLSNILIEAQEGGLRISGTDLDIAGYNIVQALVRRGCAVGSSGAWSCTDKLSTNAIWRCVLSLPVVNNTPAHFIVRSGAESATCGESAEPCRASDDGEAGDFAMAFSL